MKLNAHTHFWGATVTFESKNSRKLWFIICFKIVHRHYSCVKRKLMEVSSKIRIYHDLIKQQRENKKIKCFSLYFQGKCQRQETSGAWKLAQFNKLCQAKFSCPPILNSGDTQRLRRRLATCPR